MPNPSVTAAAEGLPTNPSHRYSKFVPRGSKPVSRLVIFRADLPSLKWTNGLATTAPRITAVFPCEPAMDGQMLGFTSAEGYMTCSRLWFDLSRPASSGQYAGLAGELAAKGFDLDIRHRITPAMDATRDWRWKEELAAEELANRVPSAALVVCRAAMDICEAVTGIGERTILAKIHGGAKSVVHARWAAMWLAHHVFGLSVADLAAVFRRRSAVVAETLRGAQRRREADPAFGLALSLMERLGRERMRVAA